jgi:glutamate carboxypeptidase
MIELVADLVRIESPSDDAGALGRMADRLEELFRAFGTVTRHPLGPGGAPHLDVRIAGPREGGRYTLVVCHYDTVWEMGTLARMPFAVDTAGVARGPGVLDMKGGIALLVAALGELAALGERPRREIRVLITCDEELRSATSRSLIEQAARDAAVALVLESPLPGGTLKTARKGSATYRIEIEGRAAHAGVEPEKGVSAVAELAHQIPAVHALADLARGTTVNVGVVRGGTRSNVVAAHAEAEVDVRTSSAAESERVDRALHALAPRVVGARVTTTRRSHKPPMERTDQIAALFQRARAIAAGMDVDLREGSTGGGSDGNLTAAAGVPTLDGLGPEGEGAHAEHEHVVVESLPRRAALIAGLLAEV